jgi:2-oxoglutarate dehydrogenase E2 component (dihydrolipoamide succinyltransferase)
MSGKITALLVEEDSTVSVGQDLLKIEPGEGGGDGSGSKPSGAAHSEAKEAEEGNRSEAAPEAKKEKAAPEDTHRKQEEKAPRLESASEQKPAPRKEEAPKPKPQPKKEEAPKQEKAVGSRNETRVSRRSHPSRAVFRRGNLGVPADSEQVKMSRMRQTIAQRLKASQNAAASLTTFNEIDMSSIMEFRKLYKDGILKAEGVKLGFMSAFARASCLALKEIPAANASIEGDTIVYRDYVDLSVAVATPKGLVTPVVRNAESMGLIEIEKAIAELGKKVSRSG